MIVLKDYENFFDVLKHFFEFVVWFVGLNGVIEAAVSFLVGGTISKAVYKFANK